MNNYDTNGILIEDDTGFINIDYGEGIPGEIIDNENPRIGLTGFVGESALSDKFNFNLANMWL